MNFLFGDRDLSYDLYLQRLHRITQSYLIAMLFAFPFFTTDRYFHILRDRSNFAIGASIIYIVAVGIILLCFTPKEEYQILKDRFHLCPTDFFLLTFLTSAFIGMFFSGNIKAVLLGSDGRYQGLILWTVYTITFFLTSRLWHANQTPLILFLLGGLCSSIWGITDFFEMDIFGWIEQISESQRQMFSSSYGNINTYTAAILLIMGAAGGCIIQFAEEERTTDGGKMIFMRDAFYYLVFIVAILALVYGRSDNATIGITVFFIVIPYWAWKTRNGFKAYWILAMCFFTDVAAVGYTLKLMTNISVDVNNSILLNVSYSYTAYMMMAACVCLCIVVAEQMAGISEYALKLLKVIFSVFVVCVIGCLIASLIIVFLGKDLTLIPIIGRYFRFGDEWGSHRGYIWRATWEEYQNLGGAQKLFGIGLEMFGNFMRTHRYQEMVQITGMFFDSPHNELLQYLMTTGCLGCICLFGWMLISCIKSLLFAHNNVSRVCAMAVLPYMAASFVNISVPITQAMVVALIGMMTEPGIKKDTKASL